MPYATGASAAAFCASASSVAAFCAAAVAAAAANEPDLSGEFTVDPDGVVVFPKLGPVHVTGYSAATLRERLVRDIGPHFACILRNHGLLTIGRTVGEAFYWMYYLEQSCRIQVAAQSTGAPLALPGHLHPHLERLPGPAKRRSGPIPGLPPPDTRSEGGRLPWPTTNRPIINSVGRLRFGSTTTARSVAFPTI